ncbi:MAG: SMP-30/gluconolactonase/LRE family protein [Planctomycetota bacterium]
MSPTDPPPPAPTPEILCDTRCETGEGPLYHPQENAIYWSDIPAGKMYRVAADAPAMSEPELIYDEGRPVGGFTLQADGALLLFRDRGNVVTWRNGAVEKTIIDHVPGLESTRFNDVIADPLGGVFCGTMSSDDVAGRLYRLTPEGEPCQLLDDQGTPNGMGFSPDRKTMYYQDSRTATLYAFDFDPATGDTANFRPLRDARAQGDTGRGDGMTIDTQGRVWSFRWGGWSFLRCDAQGVPDWEIPLPAENITSGCFGGPNFDKLFVTSAIGSGRPKTGKHAGALFRLDVGATGVAEFQSRIGLG